MSDILSIIRSGIDELRSSEKKVAAYVLKNPETVTTLSITDLAEEASTSEPTVVRFCHKLGLKGFMDLNYPWRGTSPPPSTSTKVFTRATPSRRSSTKC